jgi:hypothetical protein
LDQPHLNAEMTLRAVQGRTIVTGFRVLSAEIVGDNTKAAWINMTTPVAKPVLEKIPITSPRKQV